MRVYFNQRVTWSIGSADLYIFRVLTKERWVGPGRSRRDLGWAYRLSGC